ncbi:MAG: isoprenylcysteine carboxylmethyltransferase family protein, partial [Thermodesulfobacteriota bacterium]
DVMDNKKTSRLRKIRRIPLFIGAFLLVIFAKPQFSGIWIGFSGISIGMVLIFLGEGIRIWAAGHLQKNEVLTVTGPYAYVKNPLYIGSILITAGFCILADNIYLLAAAFFMFCFHYIPYKKKVEGDRLRKIFGSQFEDYDEKVPEYLPRWTPYSNKKVSWQFKCFIENSEEGILLIVLAGILLVLSRPYWNLFF